MSHKLTDGGQVLHVGTLARVEGEGAMHIEYRDGVVTDVQLRIYEPPRFYEAFLRGRAYTEPPDITARICGICPVAYQMSACWAIEDACGVEVPEQIAAAAPAALLRGVDREPRAARLPAPRARLPRLRRRHRDGGRPPGRRRARAADQEGRQRADGAGRRPLDPPGQRAGRRLLPDADARGAALGARPASSAPATSDRDRAAGRPGSTSPTWSSPTSTSRCGRSTATRSRRAAS